MDSFGGAGDGGDWGGLGAGAGFARMPAWRRRGRWPEIGFSRGSQSGGDWDSFVFLRDSIIFVEEGWDGQGQEGLCGDGTLVTGLSGFRRVSEGDLIRRNDFDGVNSRGEAVEEEVVVGNDLGGG